MRARIADELARPDLSSQIALAINDAIGEAATYRFWFNEVRGLTFTLTAGVADYTSDEIQALTEIDQVWMQVGTTRRNLYPQNDRRMSRLQSGNSTVGEPDTWSRYGGGLRFYPSPRQSYFVVIDGVTAFPPLTDDLDTNAWMNEGERYVRGLAKRDLLMNVIRDFDEAQAQDAYASRMRDQLLMQTSDRIATGQLAACG